MKNNKIVCIINVQRGSGMQTILDGQKHKNFHMKFLYKFTNGGNDYENLIDGKYLLISKSNGAQLVEEVAETMQWDMLWIHDQIEVANYPNCIFESKPLVMTHTVKKHPEENFSDALLKRGIPITNIKEGHHEEEDKYGYPLLRGIIEAWSEKGTPNGVFDGEKFDVAFTKIANWIRPDKFEAATEFMSIIREKKPTEEEIAELKKAINFDFKVEDLKGEPRSEEYDSSFLEVCKKLDLCY